MITWFTVVMLVVAIAAGLLRLVLGFAGRRPSDLSVGSIALIVVLLSVQVVIAIIAPFAGYPPQGDLLEYWVYLVSALILPALQRSWLQSLQT